MGRQGFVIPVCILAAGPIAAGATGDFKDRFTAKQRNYGMFRPVPRYQKAKNLSPSPEASKIGSIRRIPFDATGLAPSEEVMA